MTPPPAAAAQNLCEKIARLVQERGWNQEEFARLAELNRLTVRSIFQASPRRLHNATVAACAQALGLSVHDLRGQSLEQLLRRVREQPTGKESQRRLVEEASQPELQAWIERNPERAAELREEEIDELLSLQGTGGPLTALGVAHWVELIQRKRRLLEQVAVVAGTEYLEMLEQFIGLLFEKVQPYRDRGLEGNDSPN